MTTSSAPLTPGSHLFADSFGGGQRRRRSRRPVILASAAIVLVGLACAGTQLGANLVFDAALTEFESSARDAETAHATLASGVAALDGSVAIATTVSAADGGNLMDAADRDALLASTASARDEIAEATALLGAPLPRADEKPVWAWQLFAEAGELDAARTDVAQLSDDLADSASDAEAADDALRTVGSAALRGAADAASEFEAAHVSARNSDIIALRGAATSLSATAPAWDESSASSYSELERAATAMLESEQAELAEKQGGLRDARLEIEAFARELAPGVLLDFDWSTFVNGFGDSDSMGGYATWWYGEPGYATIELSNSVAEYWPSERSRSLVAHEVGHAISVKCEGMYDDSNQDSIEAWATAWAISMGYTSEANGTSAYGTPSQELIDAASACR